MLKYIWGMVVAFSVFSTFADVEKVQSLSDITETKIKEKNDPESLVFPQAKYNRYNIASQKLAGTYHQELDNYDFSEYSKFMEKSWNRLYNDSLVYIPNWTTKHLSSHTGKSETVFYPFGGPDVSYAFNFFPNAKRYILVGLEPLGNFNYVEKRLSNPEFYKSLQKAFSNYFRKGYFITSEMATQLSNQSLRGGINLILPALQKLGFSVIEVKSCSIEHEGEIVDPIKNTLDCVKIVCEKNSQIKEVYYVRSDLSNQNTKLDALFNLIRKSNFSTLIKSASYALHNRNFSRVRSFILNETDCILQDDTGVPFNFFRNHWDIHIFGTYTKPTLTVFRSYKQNSLSDYYSTHKAEPIPFPIGYGYTKRTPNLILAVSTPSRVQEQLKKIRYVLKKKKCNCKFNKNEE